MPIIQDETFGFVKLWNVQTIQAQKKRPYLPTGKPYMLYHYPGVGVSNFASNPPEKLVEELSQSVEDYGKKIFTHLRK